MQPCKAKKTREDSIGLLYRPGLQILQISGVYTSLTTLTFLSLGDISAQKIYLEFQIQTVTTKKKKEKAA